MRILSPLRFLEFLLLSPALLALLVSVAIFLLLPDFFPYYRIRVVDSGSTEREKSEIIFDDVDGDGQGEELQYFNNTIGKATIKITSQAGRVIGHWIFDGIMPPRPLSIFSNDIDQDGKAEVFVVIQRNDSIFLEGVRFGKRDTFFCQNVFLSTVNSVRRTFDYSVNSCQFSDLDQDGISEIIFTVMAGYPLTPRRIYLFNPATSVLLTRETDGAYFRIQELADLDGDSFPEILCNAYAIGNYPDMSKVPFHDSCAWLMVFNRKLDWFFLPIPFCGYTTNVKPRVVFLSGRTYVALVCNHRGAPPIPPKLVLLRTDGRAQALKQLGRGIKKRSYDFVPLPDRSKLCLKGPEGGPVWLDEHLDTLKGPGKSKGLDSEEYLEIKNSQGNTDLVSVDVFSGQLVITQPDLNHGTVFELPFRSVVSSRVSLITTGGKRPDLFIHSGSHFARIAYQPNPFRLGWIPLFAGIYLTVLGFILLVRRMQRWQEERKRTAERKVTELQFLVLHNQLNPHFTFNAISSISASILNDRPEEANRNLMALSRLMQSFVMGSSSLTRPLSEEFIFLENYLALMEGRLAAFEYAIDADPGVDLSWQVPRMVTHVYVENAIKHGLRMKEVGGKLWVRALLSDAESGAFIILVEDNGIGRTEAAQRSPKGTGQGMRIMEELFRQFNHYGKGKISAVVSDRVAETAEAEGTRVIITIPVDLKNRFS